MRSILLVLGGLAACNAADGAPADDMRHVQIERHAAELKDLPVAQFLGGLPMSGKADVAIDLSVPVVDGKSDYRAASGTAVIACKRGCVVGDNTAKLMVAGGLPFGSLAIQSFDARAEVRDGHARITNWRLASADLALDISLDVALAEDLADSHLDGCIRFHASPALAKRDPKTYAILATTGAEVGANGDASIKIGGTWGHRRLVGQVCDPQQVASAQ